MQSNDLTKSTLMSNVYYRNQRACRVQQVHCRQNWYYAWIAGIV